MNNSLLLHHCCAPCSVNVLKDLGRDFELLGFWFNPNIYPREEQIKRKESLERLAGAAGISILYGEEFSQEAWCADLAASGQDRCRFCYELRLTRTARAARERGIGFFSTTLLASPYQKHAMVRDAGGRIGEKEKVRFVYRDCRPFYFDGKNEARAQGLYLQKYCGCVFSLEERRTAKARKGAAA